MYNGKHIFYFSNTGGIMRNIALIFMGCVEPTPENNYHNNKKLLLGFLLQQNLINPALNIHPI